MEFDSLQTDRLTLRPFETSDVPALVPLIGAREVAATTLRIPHPYTEADGVAYITSARENRSRGDELRLAIVLRESNTLCGGIGLRIEAEHRRAELGYWIGVPYWNRGIATEAARALVTYGFESLKLNRIFAGYVSTNLASASVLKKIGMRYEGCQHSHSVKWGEFLDIELYGMLAADVRSRP
jgi:[ribosomal protein S5]-alanine N-acetyltransferase